MNGYIAIEINSEKVGLKFSMLVSRWLTDKMQEDPTIFSFGTFNEAGTAWLLFFAYKVNCDISNKPKKLHYGDFLSWVEEAEFNPIIKEQLTAAGKCYDDSMYTKKYVEELNKKTEEIKKKMIGISSNPSATENLDLVQEIIGV